MQDAGTIIQFNYADWVSEFPEFSDTPKPAAQFYWDVANDLQRQFVGWSWWWCNQPNAQQLATDRLERLMNVLTAHVAKLMSGSNGNPASDVVGRIDSATEGSVSVSADMTATQANQWFLQTKYGALYWQMTMFKRTARYFRGPNYRPPGYYNLFGSGPGWMIPGRG